MDSSSIWNFSEDSNHKCNTGRSPTSGTNILVFPMFSLAHLSLSVPPFPLPLPPFISTTYIQKMIENDRQNNPITFEKVENDTGLYTTVLVIFPLCD